ncbi:hexitol phosphatase HxpB [Paraflavisolibacter sp. H34]|uniref:hexitol phosphatase HxpB n=1 Tax=Huijunlia imazamoxiresistens TaxID=3127457 RepID=UPI0030198CE5
MLDTVIFDMDGLLVDSEPLWAVSMREVFATVGVDLSEEMALKTTGLRTKEVVGYWHQQLGWTSPKTNEQVCEEIIDDVTARIIAEGRAMEGLHHILEFFRRKDFRIGLASSSPLRLITAVLGHLGIRQQFQAIYSAEHEVQGKPHPAVYLACARELNSNPLHCLAFEDSVNGMVAAKAARMKVVAVPEPHNRTNRRFALADLQLESLGQFSEAHFQELNRW